MTYAITASSPFTIVRTDEHGERFDLNADGEPCETPADLVAFVDQLCDTGAFDAATRDALLDGFRPDGWEGVAEWRRRSASGPPPEGDPYYHYEGRLSALEGSSHPPVQRAAAMLALAHDVDALARRGDWEASALAARARRSADKICDGAAEQAVLEWTREPLSWPIYACRPEDTGPLDEREVTVQAKTMSAAAQLYVARRDLGDSARLVQGTPEYSSLYATDGGARFHVRRVS